MGCIERIIDRLTISHAVRHDGFPEYVSDGGVDGIYGEEPRWTCIVWGLVKRSTSSHSQLSRFTPILDVVIPTYPSVFGEAEIFDNKRLATYV
jgi:hypothetical protein